MVRLPHPVWLSEGASEERERITEVQDRKLLWWKKRLAEDLTAGDHISKSKIPGSLMKKYGIDNLWRIELPEGWRALYTVVSSPSEETTVSILRILSHKEYDRLFGYSTS